MSRTNAGLVEYAIKHIGHPYWYGMFGYVANEQYLKQKAAQYPSHYGTARMATYRSHFGRRVFDCIGLIKGYLWSDAAGNIRYNGQEDWSADMTLQRCVEKGPISTMPDIPGVLVFFPGHVGVYVGNGQVVEAQGFAAGVVRTQLNARPWRNWGKHPLIEYKVPTNVTVQIDGRPVNVQTQIMPDNMTYVLLDGQGHQKHWVLLRALSDLLGAKLEWTAATRTANMKTR